MHVCMYACMYVCLYVCAVMNVGIDINHPLAYLNGGVPQFLVAKVRVVSFL
jgi:hypothetical protein